MQINWYRCLTYEDAKRHGSSIVYLFERNGVPSYWGQADNFGTRYNQGYDHLIEDCLRHGGRLYIGKIKDRKRHSLQDVEDHLIERYGSEWNSLRKRKTRKSIVRLTHLGNKPESIKRGRPLATKLYRQLP